LQWGLGLGEKACFSSLTTPYLHNFIFHLVPVPVPFAAAEAAPLLDSPLVRIAQEP